MKKLIILFGYLTRYKTKIDLQKINFITNLETLEKQKTMVINGWTDEQTHMLEEIKKGNYVEGYGGSYPTITFDNVCIDGHHRVMALKDYKHGNRKIKVYKYLLKWERFNSLPRH